MVDVVGLRFVTEGEKEAIASLRMYEAGLRSLRDLQNKHVAAMNRALREQERATREAIGAQRDAATAYARLAASMDPAVDRSQQFAAAQQTIRTALAQGVISAQQATAALARLQQQQDAAARTRFVDEQRRISNEIINGNAAVNRITAAYQTMTEKVRASMLTAAQHRTAEIALARELATVNGYISANGALNTQKALAELRAAQATRDAIAADAAAAATKARLTQAYQQLLSSVNPVIARQQQTRQVIDMLRAAVAAQAITVTQAAQALLQYRAHLHSLNAAQNQAALGLNRTAVLTQQAGYQFGDFFVQIQSGTNVMVAFGQQATQMIGTFAMLARTTRAIAALSALGVLVSIGTAIGAAFMRASGATETLTQRVEKLKEAGTRLQNTFDLLSDTEIDQRFGNMADDVDRLASAMLALDSAAQMRNLMRTLDTVEAAASAGWLRRTAEMLGRSALATVPGFGEIATTPEAIDESTYQKLGFDMARETYLGYVSRLREFAEQGDTEAIVAEFSRFIADASDGADGLSSSVTTAGYEMAHAMRESSLALAEVMADMNGTADAAREAARLADEQAKADQAHLDRMQRLRGIMGQIAAERRLEQEAEAARQAEIDEARRLGLLDLAEAQRASTEEQRVDAAALPALQQQQAEQDVAREERMARLRGIMGDILAERRAEEQRLAEEQAQADQERLDYLTRLLGIMGQIAAERRADQEAEAARQAEIDERRRLGLASQPEERRARTEEGRVDPQGLLALQLRQAELDAAREESMARLRGIMGQIAAERRLEQEAEAARQAEIDEARRIGLISYIEAQRANTEERRVDADGMLTLEERQAEMLARQEARRLALIDLENQRRIMTEESRVDAEALVLLEQEQAAAAARAAELHKARALEIQRAALESVSLSRALERALTAATGISRADIASPINQAVGAASRLVGELSRALTALARIGSAVSSVGAETAAIRAETAALQSGATPGQAQIEGRIAQEALNLEGMLPTWLPEPLRNLTVEATTAPLRTAMQERLAAEEARAAAIEAATALDGGGGGGGGGPSPAEQLAEDLERLRTSLDDAYANQQRFTEGQNILNAALEAGRLKLPEYKHLLALLTEEYGAGETAAYDYAQAMLSIGETMRSGLEDAFMSIVDGSASAGDAFRNLARTVIAEAYRMLVVKPLVDMIMRGANALFGGVSIGGAPVSLLPSANGNAFMNGRVMAFADGGIVGSPTFFPMRTGMGLMGEAGPEAIMPLKRGPDGKLGVAARGDGTTVVNQYFSIAANGDESVRRIVRAEAPNIAEAAKNAVLDAKRRGGAYGRAF